ncbi:collagen alpha-1(I) chain-like [Poecile atricapillus]|uniref:collagen alpha-1(I) chain-like n=1 Tax=Poecile atricapillus TaxID=48891 RepID=UPI00273A1088|nr:collagen alpha-1(I) chain-like [Poecile atricapillus]
MARPLREGTLGEPPAPLPSHPACGGGGGGAATHGTPPQRGTDPPRTRLSCGRAGETPGTPPNLGVYGWGQQGDFGPSEDAGEEGTPQFGEGAAPNGHLPPPGPEQILGARLRVLGDAFQNSHERQRRARGLFWGPLFRWLGAGPAAPLTARGGN